MSKMEAGRSLVAKQEEVEWLHSCRIERWLCVTTLFLEMHDWKAIFTRVGAIPQLGMNWMEAHLWLVRGLMKFIPAVAYHFFLNLSAAVQAIQCVGSYKVSKAPTPMSKMPYMTIGSPS